MPALLRVVCALGCASLVFSCGGSGGGGGAPYIFTPALYAGPYHIVFLVGESGVPESAGSTWGTLTPDGVSAIGPSSLTSNEDGVVGASPPVPALSFSVSAAGELTWQSTTAEFVRGGLVREGRGGGLASTLVGGSNTLAVLFLRKGSGLSAATLTGGYHLGFLLCDTVGTVTHQGVVGAALFDGVSSALVGAEDINTDGTITAGPGLIGIGYAVAGDGTLTTTGAFSFSGGVLAGGDVAIVGGSTVAGESPQACVFVRESAAATAASLSGTYTLVGLAFEGFTAAYQSLTGTFTPDGAGAWSLTATQHSGGAIATLGPVSGTYSVAANGKVTVDTGTTIFEGAVSPTGEFAFLAGGTNAGSDPALYVLFRR